MIVPDGYNKTMAELLNEPKDGELRNDWFKRLRDKILENG